LYPPRHLGASFLLMLPLKFPHRSGNREKRERGKEESGQEGEK